MGKEEGKGRARDRGGREGFGKHVDEMEGNIGRVQVLGHSQSFGLGLRSICASYEFFGTGVAIGGFRG